MANIFIYTFGLGFPSTARLCKLFKERASPIPFFGKQVCHYPDHLLTSTTPQRVGDLIKRLAGPKLVIFLFRHDCVGSAEHLVNFFKALCQRFSEDTQTQLAVCYPLPNTNISNHFEACLEVTNFLLAFACQRKLRLKILAACCVNYKKLPICVWGVLVHFLSSKQSDLSAWACNLTPECSLLTCSKPSGSLLSTFSKFRP